MQILFLSSHLPSPRAWQAGQKMSYHVCEFLGRKHEMHLLCFANQKERAVFDGLGMGIFHCWDTVPVNQWTRLCGALSSPRSPLPVGVRSSRTFRSKLRRLMQTHQFDAVILDHTAMWQYAGDLVSVPMLGGIAHDVLSQLWERRAYQAGSRLGISSWLSRFESRRILEWEKQSLSMLDFVVSFSKKDDLLLGLLAPEVDRLVIQPWVSYPTNVDFGCDSVRKPTSVVFWGALDRRENIDAVSFAVREILPLVREALPDFEFYVAGSRSDVIGPVTDGVPNVIRTGFIDDIGSFLAGMQVALLPLRQGAGVKFKTLECMAAGVAVVTTPVGVEGIAATHGVHLLVGETPEALARYTVELLRRTKEAREMGERARTWFASQYDFGRAMSVLESFLVANNRRTTRRKSSSSFTTESVEVGPMGNTCN